MRIHLLSIGNSFSDDAHRYMYDILKNDGFDDIIIANLYIGGCTLERHFKNIESNLDEYEFRVYDDRGCNTTPHTSVLYGLKYTEWDYITFQQASYLSGIKDSYYYDKDKLYFDPIKEYCLKNINNHPKFLFHLTWSYEKGYEADTFNLYNYSQELMEIKLEEVLNDIIKKYPFDGIIPSMQVVRNLRLIHGRPVTRDGFHMYFGIGRYAIGLAFVRTIYKDSKLYSSNEYNILDEKEKAQAKEAVLKTFNELNI